MVHKVSARPENISPEALDHELRNIAKHYLDRKTKTAALSPEDPEVIAFIQQARQAVEAINFSLAERLFDVASQQDEQAAQASSKLQRSG